MISVLGFVLTNFLALPVAKPKTVAYFFQNLLTHPIIPNSSLFIVLCFPSLKITFILNLDDQLAFIEIPCYLGKDFFFVLTFHPGLLIKKHLPAL